MVANHLPIKQLCERAFETDLPIFMVNANTWQTSLNLQSFGLEVPADDERIEKFRIMLLNISIQNGLIH